MQTLGINGNHAESNHDQDDDNNYNGTDSVRAALLGKPE
jgi:hypothetical protein